MGGKWFEMWFADKQSLLEIMIRNLVADTDNENLMEVDRGAKAPHIFILWTG